jgi:hypothetical protein
VSSFEAESDSEMTGFPLPEAGKSALCKLLIFHSHCGN